MKWPGEEKQQKEDAIIEGKDTECAADVEGLEEVRLMERVQKDAGDEKAGEDKKEVDPDIEGANDMAHTVEEPVAGLIVRTEQMNEEDKKDCQASYPVESWNVRKPARILGIPR
jgi:hypothetical protein